MSKINKSFLSRAKSAKRMKDEYDATEDFNGSLYDLRTVTIGGVQYYPFVFSKSLPHDPTTGFVKKMDADKMIRAIQTGLPEDRANVVLSPDADRKLVSLNDGLSVSLVAADPRAFPIGEHHDIGSKEQMFEMMEVYEQALLRDASFYDIQNNTGGVVDRTLATLNAFGTGITAPTDNGAITAKTLFRGEFPGERRA